jgi:hypothetical protein
MPHNYEKTKYPNIYKNTYWGRFKYDDTVIRIQTGDDEIIKNRNDFIKNFKIKKFQRDSIIENMLHPLKNGNSHRKFLDHVEAYKDDDKNYVVITSPYTLALGDVDVEQMKKWGWVQIGPLYHNDATSFVIVLSKYNIEQYMRKIWCRDFDFDNTYTYENFRNEYNQKCFDTRKELFDIIKPLSAKVIVAKCQRNGLSYFKKEYSEFEGIQIYKLKSLKNINFDMYYFENGKKFKIELKDIVEWC